MDGEEFPVPGKEYIFVPQGRANPRIMALHGATVIPLEFGGTTKWHGIDVWRAKIRGKYEYVLTDELVEVEEAD